MRHVWWSMAYRLLAWFQVVALVAYLCASSRCRINQWDCQLLYCILGESRSMSLLNSIFKFFFRLIFLVINLMRPLPCEARFCFKRVRSIGHCLIILVYIRNIIANRYDCTNWLVSHGFLISLIGCLAIVCGHVSFTCSSILCYIPLVHQNSFVIELIVFVFFS